MSANLVVAASARPTRNYRDFLTPILHARFVQSSLLPLGLCYAEAVWLGEWHCETRNLIYSSYGTDIVFSRSILAMVPDWSSRHTYAAALLIMPGYTCT